MLCALAIRIIYYHLVQRDCFRNSIHSHCRDNVWRYLEIGPSLYVDLTDIKWVLLLDISKWNLIVRYSTTEKIDADDSPCYGYNFLMTCLASEGNGKHIFPPALYFHFPANHLSYIDGILPKGPYPPRLRMADRALLAGYYRHIPCCLLLVHAIHVRSASCFVMHVFAGPLFINICF